MLTLVRRSVRPLLAAVTCLIAGLILGSLAFPEPAAAQGIVHRKMRCRTADSCQFQRDCACEMSRRWRACFDVCF